MFLQIYLIDEGLDAYFNYRQSTWAEWFEENGM